MWMNGNLDIVEGLEVAIVVLGYVGCNFASVTLRDGGMLVGILLSVFSKENIFTVNVEARIGIMVPIEAIFATTMLHILQE